MPKPAVFLTRALPEAVMTRLAAETYLTANPHDRPLTAAKLAAGVAGQDALITTLADPVDAALLDRAPGLKVVANYAVGYNNIDVAAAQERGVAVTNTPGVLTDATADIAFGLLLTVGRRIAEGDRFVRTGAWTGWAPLQLLGGDVTGATLGLIGLGRIGKAVAQRARGFDMRLLYWNRTRLSAEEEAKLGLTYAPIEDVLATADFVSLHVALTPETHHLINADRLALMKPTAYLINTARGAVIDEGALVAALQAGQIAGAGLDVFEEEPKLHPGLAALDNVVIPPHLGSATVGTRTKMGMMVVDNVLAACAGETPPNLVT